MVRHALLAVLALAAISACSPKAAKDARQVIGGAVTPVHYEIAVAPDAKALTFEGSVGIDIDVSAPTATVTLNAADLAFDTVSIDGTGDKPKIVLDAKLQTATFTFAKPIAAGRHRLAIAYHGKIYQQAFGLFAIDYDTAKGPERLLATQFEAPDARRFVPSWDEPARKATFTLTVTAPADRMVVSNTPIATTTKLEGGYQKVTFQRTPKMSTYLLFLAIGDLERIHQDVGGVDVGVLTKHGDTAQGKFALQAASEILPYYNDYFGTAFPLPKLDLLAIPGSANRFSAMENWGAIFYFEKALLVDPAISSETDRQRVFSVIAHEMAHQWFGDLVTMSWWDEIWLNEGFASWMAAKATDKLHPAWSPWLGQMQGRDAAMRLDARSSATHPVVVPVTDPQNTPFDTISYQKGQAVIRMLESYLGDDVFRDGIRRYMKAHAYGNPTTADLWKALGEASGQDVASIAHDFTTQPGVPLITLTQVSCLGEETTASLTQGHFAVEDPGKTVSRWKVPIVLQTLSGQPQKITAAGAQATEAKVAGCTPLIVNAGQTGYFRTAYPAEALAKLAQVFTTLAPADQLGLLYDRGALGRSGQEAMADYFDLAGRVGADAAPEVWGQVIDTLTDLDGLYSGQTGQAAFRAKARTLLAPIWAKVGWTPSAGETDNIVILRENLIKAMGKFDDPTVLTEAKRRFEALRKAPKSLPGALREPVLAVVGAHADAATWDAMQAMARATAAPLEKQQIYVAMGGARDPALANKALNLTLGEEAPVTIRTLIIGAVSAQHSQLAWNFIKANEPALNKMLAPASLIDPLPRIIRDWTDADLAKDVREHMAKPGATAQPALVQALSAIEERARVRRERLSEIDAWAMKP